jgi:predicted ATPase
MRIRQVTIKNFRCLEDVTIDFDAVTTFLGPNGAGKSTILRALDWFFNGSQGGLGAEDAFMEDDTRVVSVSVTFDSLTAADRERLGKYASASTDTVSISKHWERGEEKLIGRALAFLPFEGVRAGRTATERKARYQAVLEQHPDLDLPKWSNDATAAATMSAWEGDNGDLLTEADVESRSHFFGFAGQATMSGLFDFVLVSADLRASEEAMDSRSAILGRILELAIDRSGASAELDELFAETSRRQAAIEERHFGKQLDDLSDELTGAVSTLATGRQVRISSQPTPVPPSKVRFDVKVLDRTFETRVDRQGHGFQRALLIAALKLLADRGRGSGDGGVMCLAIEEPELYQHPLQARSFAAVLRTLAEDEGQGVQVVYATHSPYFIEAKCFHQIRRVTRSTLRDGSAVEVLGATVEAVVRRLDGFVDEERIRRQLDGVCMGSLAEAFFADAVLLVEGSTDRAVLTGAAARQSIPLLLDGIYIGEAGGKQGLLLPYAILELLGVPAYLVADNDSHLLDQQREAAAAGNEVRARDLLNSVHDHIEWNRRLLRFFGVAEEDWPKGMVARNFMFVDGGLEQALEKMWPDWAAARNELIEGGSGFSRKDRATYEEAAMTATTDPPSMITDLLEGARALTAA